MPSNRLSPDRLQAFSDGVIAVIITIMVLELKVPPPGISDLDAVRQELPLLLVYLLSFILIGIYWVNHHYLVEDVEQVTHGILWSNLALLFALSLIPAATDWVGIRGITSFSVSLYAIACALPGVAWLVLSSLICRRTGIQPDGSMVQQFISFSLYVGSIFAAWYSPRLALCMIALVAVRWLLPPKRIVELTRTKPENS